MITNEQTITTVRLLNRKQNVSNIDFPLEAITHFT